MTDMWMERALELVGIAIARTMRRGEVWTTETAHAGVRVSARAHAIHGDRLGPLVRYEAVGGVSLADLSHAPDQAAYVRAKVQAVADDLRRHVATLSDTST